ncbi:MAG TPA: DUF898 domain-containing protein [Methylophilaceae bacterium]|nr:DUF898 domain-containing protein [Methylophilaceae bacterium]
MSSNQTQIEFTGKAGEYFGIWIVNLLLSIVTLGIYSAWAKVRRKKYFYNNTLIEGVGFDYHAKPMAILKGRIIAVALFILYQVLTKFSPIAGAVLLVLFLVALPWILVRGLTFNARNSSHRGLRFDFDGQYGQAARVMLLYPILIFLTLGLALPFVAQRMNQFVFNHHKFGLSHFQMNALVKDFYKVYLKMFGLIIALAFMIGVGMALLIGTSQHHASLDNAHAQTLPTTASTDQKGHFMYVGASEENVNSAQEDYLKDLSPEERAEFETQMKQLEKMQQDQAAEAKKTKNPFGDMIAAGTAKYGALFFVVMLIPVLLYAILIFSFSAYFQSRISNLLWNNTQLEHIEFSANQRMRDLLWLYLSNTIVLVCTLGLATPWAQIRLARYRLQHIAISGEADWDKFVGEKKEATRAVGEEIADMFDVDLSFG